MSPTTLALVLLGPALVAPVSARGPVGADQKRIIADIRRLGGDVRVDEQRPGKPVVCVSFEGPPHSAAKWAALVRAFPHLEEFRAC